MRKISTRSRTAFTFIIITSAIVLILSVLFSINGYLILENKIQNDLNVKYLEITNAYINLYSKNLRTKDLDIDSLKKITQIDQVSLIIYNKEKEIIGNYGDFKISIEVENNRNSSTIEIENKEKLEIYMDEKDLDLALTKTAIDTATGIDGEQFRVFSGPIINSRNETIGIIQIASADTTFKELIASYIISTFLTSFLILIISIYTSKKISNWLLEPLMLTTSRLRNIDLSSLHKRVPTPDNIPEGDPLYLISKEFNTLLGRLEKANIKQKNFISNASHELKTPLAVINSSVDLIELGDPKENEAQVKLIRREIRSMKELLENLLFLSRLENKPQINERDSANFRTVLSEVLKKYDKQITSKKLILNLNKVDEISIPLHKDYLVQLLNNLISNSIKYSYVKGKIEIFITKKGDTFIFGIKDNGIGINKIDQEKIFDRFFRAKNAIKANKGNGLGLAIVKDICDLHNFDIKLFSSENEGTKILISGKLNN
ncbi:HAMP domain-containing histidine kinase [Candidatus Dojkabacteria bacterium]|nr:HAMP domain-containing histidine kinase [Candidatus Dojkabacteria bacterium]